MDFKLDADSLNCMPENRKFRYFGLIQSQDETPTRRLAGAIRPEGQPIDPAITC
jgi:hypothetical protein